MSTKLLHTCSHRGCERAFESEQALRMHVGRVHTRTILNGQPTQKKRKYSQSKAAVAARRQRAARKTRKPGKNAVTNGIPLLHGLHFCPNCAMPLTGVAAQLELMRGEQ